VTDILIDATFKIVGREYQKLVQFFDMLSEGIMMPLGALLMSIMIGWELGPDVVKEECEQSGHPMSGYGFFKVCVKFITPLCMILILYGQIKDFFF
jgi:NSS family neurotransmitter:Na+ symporter